MIWGVAKSVLDNCSDSLSILSSFTLCLLLLFVSSLVCFIRAVTDFTVTYQSAKIKGMSVDSGTRPRDFSSLKATVKYIATSVEVLTLSFEFQNSALVDALDLCFDLCFKVEEVPFCDNFKSSSKSKHARIWSRLSKHRSTKWKDIENCKKFGQTELIKKSNLTILTDFCMQFLFSFNLETQNRTEKLDFACKIFPK